MLASIHPLGERARGQSFFVTAVAYAFGSVAGAAALGALLERSGRAIPSWHRQVNEDWLTQYRGWVYGLGFGVQLGLGVVTIVTTAAVYLTWVAAFVSGSAAIGAAVGAAFGLARAL